MISRNPTDGCIAPKVQKVEMKTLLPEHLKSYLDAADARGVLPMFYLELVSGLRKGELVALLWSDLDANHKTISVSKQYVRNPSGAVMRSRPKTETSVRQVSIPQDAVDLLIHEHDKHPNNPYMFPSPVTGKMYHPDSVVKLHEKILKDAGLEHIRFHDLRHPNVKPKTQIFYIQNRNPRTLLFSVLGFLFCVYLILQIYSSCYKFESGYNYISNFDFN